MSSRPTPEKIIAEVRRLAALGELDRDIAGAIGISKNAVIGVRHRNGIPSGGGTGKRGRNSYVKPSPAHAAKVARAIERKMLVAAPKKPTIAAPAPHVIIYRPAKEVTGFVPCLWAGCCKPHMSPGKPYCSDHHIKAGGLF